VTTTPAQKNMLRTYGKQLTSARRLIRLGRAVASGDAKSQDEELQSREAKRKELVERISREIVDNLLITGSDSPIIEEIQRELEREMRTKLLFRYPLPERDMHVHIFKRTPHGEVEVSEQEREIILAKLWHITLAKVDETMM
jgi:hypothetical protein